MHILIWIKKLTLVCVYIYIYWYISMDIYLFYCFISMFAPFPPSWSCPACLLACPDMSGWLEKKASPQCCCKMKHEEKCWKSYIHIYDSTEMNTVERRRRRWWKKVRLSMFSFLVCCKDGNHVPPPTLADGGDLNPFLW